MTEALAQKISEYLVSINAAAEEDKEVIAYGLFHILSSATQIAVLFISASFLKILPQAMAYTVCFGSLKRYAGGAHANRHWICLWGFTALVYISYFLCSALPVSTMPYVSIVAAALTLLLVMWKAPVVHPNNPKPAKKIINLRKIAVAVALVQFTAITVSILFLPAHLHLYVLCGSAGGLSAAVTLILPMSS